jgi:hypothetical protein
MDSTRRRAHYPVIYIALWLRMRSTKHASATIARQCKSSHMR